MKYDAIIEELNSLPSSCVSETMNFIQYLKYRESSKTENLECTSADDMLVDYYKPLTSEELAERLEHSRLQIESGNVLDAKASVKLLREKYGL